MEHQISLKLGDIAPDFEIPDINLKNMRLSDIKDKKVILAFFPAAESPVCTAEMCNFRDTLSEFNNKNVQVIGISVDGPFANKSFTENRHLNFPVLSDYKREVIKNYGIVMKDLSVLKTTMLQKGNLYFR
jgi:peroxiredoxin